jgi:hypothetical protein
MEQASLIEISVLLNLKPLNPNAKQTKFQAIFANILPVIACFCQ